MLEAWIIEEIKKETEKETQLEQPSIELYEEDMETPIPPPTQIIIDMI